MSVPSESGARVENGMVIPVHGPFDRVRLGLQLRQWGSEFPSILLLACAKLSLDTFIKHVEDDSLLVQELIDTATRAGESLSRHASAHHLVQAFLQYQLQSAGVEVRGGGEIGVVNGKDIEQKQEQGNALFRDAARAMVQGTGGAAITAKLKALLAESLQGGAACASLVLDAVSSLGLEEEGRRPLLLSGKELKQEVLTRIPNGPVFSQVHKVKAEILFVSFFYYCQCHYNYYTFVLL